MSNCLICQQKLTSKTLFTQVLFFASSVPTSCSDCLSSFEKIAEQHCPTCFKSGVTDCTDCHYWQRQGKEVSHSSLYQYNQAMASYFSLYKFQGDYLLRKVFTKELTVYFKQWTDYAIVPIPLAPKRLEERGFNQVSALLEEAGISYCNLLGKKDIAKQSDKTRKERLKLTQPFYLIEENCLPEKILLVDDIYTTGATIQLAKEILIEKGVKTVKSFSIAR